MSQKINILHLDTEKSWRGGQQQAFYLHKSLISKGIKSLLVSNSGAEILKRCKNENLPYFELSMFGELDILAAYKLFKLCKKKNINILQAHSAHALSIGIFTKLFYPALILIGVRRVDFSIGKNILSKIKYKNNFVNKIICISDYIKNVLLADGVPEKKLITVRSGVDINKFDKVKLRENFRSDLGIKNDEILIGTVAAFAGHKDYPNLLNAFKIVVEKLDNVKLCIIGDGPLKDEINSLIDKLEIREKLILTGFKSSIGEYLKSFDLFVLSSKKEGLGTSIIDALSVGLPVVVTKAGGIPELIRHGKNGILVEPKNAKELADGIIKLINDKSMLKKLSLAARESSKQFSVEETVQQNIATYNSLII